LIRLWRRRQTPQAAAGSRRQGQWRLWAQAALAPGSSTASICTAEVGAWVSHPPLRPAWLTGGPGWADVLSSAEAVVLVAGGGGSIQDRGWTGPGGCWGHCWWWQQQQRGAGGRRRGERGEHTPGLFIFCHPQPRQAPHGTGALNSLGTAAAIAAIAAIVRAPTKPALQRRWSGSGAGVGVAGLYAGSAFAVGWHSHSHLQGVVCIVRSPIAGRTHRHAGCSGPRQQLAAAYQALQHLSAAAGLQQQ
jgi:hypothetical protein